MKQNTQPIEVRNLNEDGSLEVHSIFYTIQGEGPFAGRPAVFIRLAGCNLQCPGCDTDYTSKRLLMSVKEITNAIYGVIPDGLTILPIVVITGGEPFRQNITSLVDHLYESDFEVQIETNGVLEIPVEVYSLATIICSPKTSLIHRHNHNRIDAFKYVVHASSISKTDGLPFMALNHNNNGKVYRPNLESIGSVKVYVQPMDCQDCHQNLLNQKAAVESCMKFGYTLQLQIHKIIGVE